MRAQDILVSHEKRAVIRPRCFVQTVAALTKPFQCGGVDVHRIENPPGDDGLPAIVAPYRTNVRSVSIHRSCSRRGWAGSVPSVILPPYDLRALVQ